MWRLVGDGFASRVGHQLLGWSLVAGLLVSTLPLASGQKESVVEQDKKNGAHPGGLIERHLLVYLEAASETSGPYLSLRGNDSTVNEYRDPVLASPVSGALGLVRSQANLGRDTLFVTLDKPLDRTHYLNLSHDISGTLYWTSTAAQTTQKETNRLRIELCLGTEVACNHGNRIGGSERTYDLSWTPSKEWTPINFQFRSEVANLSRGDLVSLKITRISGASEFILGTGDAQQSRIDFPYYDRDPLSGLAYVEDGNLSLDPEQDDPLPLMGPRHSSSSLPLGGFLVGLPIFAFVALRRPSRGTHAVLFVLLLIGLTISGCMGNPTTPKLGPPPTATDELDASPSVNFEHRDDLEAAGIGAIQATIRGGDVGFPMERARVLLLGTNQASHTNASGQIWFTNLTHGDYVMRVEAQKHDAVEEPVAVKLGYVTKVAIRLIVANLSGIPHDHDLWTAPRQLFFETTFTPLSWPPIKSPIPGVWVCFYFEFCETEIPINVSQPVLPGTARLEVVLDWPLKPGAPTELDLFATSPARGGVRDHYVARSPNDPFFVTIWPHEADPGHQSFTNWVFTLTTSYSSLYNPSGPLATVGDTPVKVQIWGHKGVVPLEPRHRDIWNGRNEITLFQDEKLLVNTYYDMPNKDSFWEVKKKGGFVPPGTKEITGRLWWDYDWVDPPNAPSWGLSYKGADVPLGAAKFTPIEMGPLQSGNRTFTLRFPVEEADQYYQRISYWKFYPDDGAAPAAQPPIIQPMGYHTTLGIRFYLTATAIRDPAYVDKDDGQLAPIG